MNLPNALLPNEWTLAGNLIFLGTIGYILKTISWEPLKENYKQHVWLGLAVGLMLIWSIKTGVRPGLNFHMLGASLLTLMFGPHLAILNLVFVLLGVTIAGMSGWDSFAWNAILMAILPSTFTAILFNLVDKKLPNHFFVYIFANAFIGSGMAIFLVGVMLCTLFIFSGVYTTHYLWDNYLPYYILMAWSEGFTTGMAMTVLVVYRPQWVSTFDDLRYIKNK